MSPNLVRSSRISTKSPDRKHVDHAGSCGIGKRCATREDLLLRPPESGPPAGPMSEMGTYPANLMPALNLTLAA